MIIMPALILSAVLIPIIIPCVIMLCSRSWKRGALSLTVSVREEIRTYVIMSLCIYCDVCIHMHICIIVTVHMCVSCLNAFVHNNMLMRYTHTYTCTCACTYTCTHTCTYACIYICCCQMHMCINSHYTTEPCVHTCKHILIHMHSPERAA